VLVHSCSHDKREKKESEIKRQYSFVSTRIRTGLNGVHRFSRVDHGTHISVNIKTTTQYKYIHLKHSEQVLQEIKIDRGTGRQIKIILGNINSPHCELGTGLIEYYRRVKG
jgi:hypothetical protein